MSGPLPESSPQRSRRLATAGVLSLVLLLGGCAQFMQNPVAVTGSVLSMFGDILKCTFTSCEPEVPQGMTITQVSEDTGVDPIVAIDVDSQGRVFAAHSGRMDNGVLDNRDFDEAGLDEELAMQSVEDRRKMIDRAVAAGRYPPEYFTQASDAVAVFEDQDGDGVLETRTEVATFNGPTAGIGSGVLLYGDDVYYTNIPDVWRLHDDDGDGLPDSKEVLSTGWGVRWAFYGHDMHGLVLGPDGKIYFSIGDRGFNAKAADGSTVRPQMDSGRGAVLRMNPDGSALELFAQGLRNPQEIAFDDFGNLFTADNNSDSLDEARIVYVVEGGDSGWAMPYQLLRELEYERGPWNAEKLWYPQHEGQPAYIIPPLRFIGRGPAGFAHAPGLGLPERYRNSFLAADYAYIRSRSGIRSFEVEQEGAGFRATEPEWFVRNLLTTDLAFALDGSTLITQYAQIPPRSGEIFRLAMEAETLASQKDRIAEMGEIVRAGMEHRSAAELATLLGFEDRRVRMPAQFELVRRRAAATLGAVARDRGALLLARLHAIWGLGQVGAQGLRSAGWKNLDAFAGDEAEMRAQAVRVVGTARATWLAPALVPFLRDESARVRYFAAISIGKLRYREAIPALADLLRENDGKDIYLRHAVALAFHDMRDGEALDGPADDSSAAVRMGVLLAMRRSEDPALARFLHDPDPRLVLESTRAIHDLSIEAAELELAELAGTNLPYADDDPQTSYALHRRIVNANLRLGTAEAAQRLAAYAADPTNPERMRSEALAALGHFTAPPPRDAVLGTWHPLDPREDAVVYPALDRHMPTLLQGDLEGQALDVASSYERLPLSDAELEGRVTDAKEESGIRIASLAALSARSDGPSGDALAAATSAGLASRDPALRAEARDVLAVHDPDRAIEQSDTLGDAAPVLERQRSIAMLASLGAGGNGAADIRLARAVERLNEGDLPADVQLDVLEAARGRDSEELRAGLARYEAGLDPADPLAKYRIALRGGDAERGATVFNGTGDCKRCHTVDGEGGATGPELTGLGDRTSRAEILEALLVPDATIASGFEQATGGSAMPPIAVELPPSELRDLMAYLAGLN
ncbi:MAG: c-type cytochrome [Candidatus Binatia bacterium]|nr:c-type cytochrome [Candidatus Binatia bacterium]